MMDDQLLKLRVPTGDEFALLDRIAAGEYANGDAPVAHVERDPALRTILGAMRDVDSEARRGPWDFARAWTAFGIRMPNARHSLRLVPPDVAVVDAPAPPRRVLRSLPSSRWMGRSRSRVVGTGAIACVLAVLAWFGWEARESRTSPVSMRELATQVGQRMTVRLDDGTMVTLAPDSRLRVPDNYGMGTRDLILEGSAYFDIAHNVKQPFVIQVRGVHVRVLGTKFAVRAYGVDSVIVAVSEGKVALARREDSDEAIVMAGHVGVMTANGTMHINPANVERYTAWSEDRLVFEETPAAEVMEDLSRWYGVRFVLGDSVLERRTLSTEWPEVPATHVIRAIGLLWNVRAERHGDEVVLYPRGPG